MKRILFAMLLSAAIPAAHAQDFNTDRILLADETTLETAFMQPRTIMIVSANDSISKRIINHYTPCECIKYTERKRKHKKEEYTEWTIWLPREYRQDLIKAFTEPEDLNTI